MALQHSVSLLSMEKLFRRGPALADLVYAYLHLRVSQMASVPPVLPWVQSILHTVPRLEGSSQTAKEIRSPPPLNGSHCPQGKSKLLNMAQKIRCINWLLLTSLASLLSFSQFTFQSYLTSFSSLQRGQRLLMYCPFPQPHISYSTFRAQLTSRFLWEDFPDSQAKLGPTAIHLHSFLYLTCHSAHPLLLVLLI